jgi:hypothetical protein
MQHNKTKFIDEEKYLFPVSDRIDECETPAEGKPP